MMFIHLLVTFTLLHRVLCDLSCYECDSAANIFNYTITEENIPMQLNNCSIVTNQWYCLADIAWERDPVKSNIRLGSFGGWKSKPMAHSLEVNVFAPDDPFRPRVRNFIRYMCLTDKCNDPATLQSLLGSLALTDRLEELEYLLKSNETFDGRWCLLSPNSNVVQANSASPIDPAICKQCWTYVNNASEERKTIATCRTDFPRSNRLAYGVVFDMDSRTRSTAWSIDCQSPDCNVLSTGDRMYEKSTINFDIDKFLHSISGGLSIMPSIDFVKTLLIFLIVWAIKEIRTA